VAAQPGDRNGRSMLGDAYMAVSRFVDAAKQFRAARLSAKLASALFRAADYTAAAEVARDLDSAEGRFLYGASLLNLQRPEEALPVLEAALRLDPKILPAHAAAGKALLMLGKPREAIPHLEAAAPADEDGSVHFQLAQAYRATGQPDRAAQAAAKHRALTR
jgi:tetratricopeptide (TPR) repeat protein